ncbi:MAG: TIGR01841 family phasin [Roseococcus sp.]|nr:TIGR01841 family phasin [Roseococcus sp.]
MANQADMKKAMTQAAQTGAASAKKIVEDSTAQARVAVEKTMETANKTAGDMLKAAEEAAEFSRGNLEAITKASQLYVTGVQDLSRQTMAMFQAFSEHAIEGVKAMSTMKSLKDAADFQATFTKTAFERAVNDTTKISEAALKLAETSIEPISARMTLAMEKIAKPIAA